MERSLRARPVPQTGCAQAPNLEVDEKPFCGNVVPEAQRHDEQLCAYCSAAGRNFSRVVRRHHDPQTGAIRKWHPAPAQTREHYGEIAKAKLDAPDQITVELRAYTAMCCPHSFTAKIAEDGMTFSGAWPSGPNQAPRATEWEKMPGDSCIAKGDLKTP